MSDGVTTPAGEDRPSDQDFDTLLEFQRRLVFRFAPMRGAELDTARRLLERYCPASQELTDTQVGLERLALWLSSEGRYGQAPQAWEASRD